MNKRGQERSILYWVLGLIALAIIAIGVYTFFNTLTESIDIAPDQASLRAKACTTAINEADYCRYTDAGKKAYINCAYGEANFRASVGSSDYSCGVDTDKNKCLELAAGKTIGTIANINGKLCGVDGEEKTIFNGIAISFDAP